MSKNKRNVVQPYKKKLAEFLKLNLGTSYVRKVAERADVAHTTVYRYFNTAVINEQVEIAAFEMKHQKEMELAKKLEAAS